MMRHKITILSTQFPPTRGGVSDFTQKLIHHLSSTQDLVLDLFDMNQKQGVTTPCETHHFKGQIRGLPEWIRHLRQFKKQMVFIQYTPYTFALQGFLVVVVLLVLKLFHMRAVLHAHELYQPWDKKRLRSILRGFFHRLVWIGAVLLSDHVLVSSQAELQIQTRRWRWFRPASFFTACPSPSNIEKVTIEPAQKIGLIGHLNLSQTAFRFLVFGLPANLKPLLPFFEAVAQGLKGKGESEILFVGCQKSDFPGFFARYGHCIPAGFLSEREVAHLFSICQVALCPFRGGISMKHTSSMAAMQHGIPVLTTYGPYFDEQFKKSDIAQIVPFNEQAFRDAALDLMQNESRRNELLRKAAKYYQDHFSFQTVGAIYESILKTIR